mgnify:CR=1 FL=1
MKCEDCNGCPYAERCKKTPHNRRISLNRELTKVHADVIGRLTDTRGFLLRRNRAIQAEGTFGVMKNDREYDRIVRRGMDSVKMEVFLVSIGFNLYKYHRKQQVHNGYGSLTFQKAEIFGGKGGSIPIFLLPFYCQE